LVAFFVFCWPASRAVAETCPRYSQGAHRQVAHVYDGDTVRLRDGSKVRLAGINTPELSDRHGQAEPYARRAREVLRRILDQAGNRVFLRPAQEGKDRYGRQLAHLYTPDGDSLQALLLEAGIALVHVHPPNLHNLSCYLAAERRARASGLGLWQSFPLRPATLPRDFSGFALIRDRVDAVKHSRRSLWIELDSGVSLRIAKEDVDVFAALKPDQLDGMLVEARGWIRPYRGRPRLRVRHPAALRVVH